MTDQAVPIPSKLQSRSLWVSVIGILSLLASPIVQALSLQTLGATPEQIEELTKALGEGDWVKGISIALIIVGYLASNAFKKWVYAKAGA